MVDILYPERVLNGIRRVVLNLELKKSVKSIKK